MFFNRVVDPLDEHAGQVGLLQQIGHSGAVTERVYSPPAARNYTCDSKQKANNSGKRLEEEQNAFKENHSPQQDALKVPQIILSPTEPDAASAACEMTSLNFITEHREEEFRI